MKKKIVSALLCVAMIATMVTGCGGSKSSSTSGNADSTAKQFEINAAIAANPPALDPHTVNANVTGAIGIHIYEALFQMDENYEPQPVLAESYEMSDDGKEYTIKLRQGVKFHNGDEMKADDVVASMNRWMELSPKAKTLIGGSVFEKVDDYTVNVTVERETQNLKSLLAEWTNIIFKKGDNGYIFTGPYIIKNLEPEVSLTLEPNQYYENSEKRGEVIIKAISDMASMKLAFESGELDMAFGITPEIAGELKDEGKIVVIRPQKPVVVDRIERDIQKLTDFYQEGYECAKAIF